MSLTHEALERGMPPRASGEMMSQLAGAMCEALSRWGDIEGCLRGVCRAVAENVPPVLLCAMFVRERRGEWAVKTAQYPEQAEPGWAAAIRDLAHEVLGTGRDLSRRGDDGRSLYCTSSSAGGYDCAIGVGLSAESRGDMPGYVRVAAAYALELTCTALRSLEASEAAMEERVLKRVNMARSEMVGFLSHEIRTPLTVIKGCATALLRKDITWDERTRTEFVQVISEESDRLERMASNILDMTAFEAANVSIEKSAVRLPKIVSDVVSKLGIKSRNHTFMLDFAPDFPVVPADPLRIEQVIYNLLDNAIKYSPDGGLIVVGGRVRPDGVVISVADQGRGIPAEHLNRLFEKFFRISPHGRVRGIGLGLPIARQIVEAHGGEIWAESVEGKGTTVRFTLPALSATGGS
ncbi:MAG: ATP-binding protein [Firmicutes bacterium]|nr:ATP-binding protein [Bacillota bacterium]